jgi:hypothetical protein
MDTKRAARVALALVLSLTFSCTGALSAQAPARGLATEKTEPPGLPEIGLWMISREGTVADWLGEAYQGKKLLEPINVILVDTFATSVADAVSRLQAACDKSGFPQREGHSGGYSAQIGASLFTQCPPGTEDTFSDEPFAFGNNHGRIFGPVEWKGAYYFTAAFSREGVDLVTKVKHIYESFDRARDSFAKRMSENSEYKISSYLALGNAILGSDSLTTGDHDGVAVLLKAIR